MSALSRPDKYLRYSEDHFQGYWVQLTTLMRSNEDADEILDGLLINPLKALRKAINSIPPNANMVAIAAAIRTLYVAGNYGDPAGSFPPTEEQMLHDPLKIFNHKSVLISFLKILTPGVLKKFPLAIFLFDFFFTVWPPSMFFFLLLSQRIIPTTTRLYCSRSRCMCEHAVFTLACLCGLIAHVCARQYSFIVFFYFVVSLCGVFVVRACFIPRAFVRMCDVSACCLIKLCMSACAC